MAAATRPTVSAGSTMWRSQPAGSSNSGRYPDVGSQPSVDANNAISRMRHPEVGNRHPELAGDPHDRVADSLPSCSADQMPAGSAISSAITMPTNAERDGRGQTLEQDHGDGIAVAEADAQIAGQRRAHVAEELLDDRPVQPAGRPQRLVGLGRVAGAQRDAHRVAGHQMHEREHHHEHAEQHHHRIQQPAGQEPHDRMVTSRSL